MKFYVKESLADSNEVGDIYAAIGNLLCSRSGDVKCNDISWTIDGRLPSAVFSHLNYPLLPGFSYVDNPFVRIGSYVEPRERKYHSSRLALVSFVRTEIGNQDRPDLSQVTSVDYSVIKNPSGRGLILERTL